MKDLSVSNDFFNYSLIKNDINKVPLTLDNVISILPHIASLISSKYEVYIKNGVKSSWNILKCFSHRIVSMKNVPITGGVDLAREERLKKCDQIIEQFEKILTSHNIEKILKKQNNDDVK